MKTKRTTKPLPLLGERRYLVVNESDVCSYGCDWQFEGKEFMTLATAMQKQSRAKGTTYILEFYLPEGALGTLGLTHHLHVPLRARIVGGGL